MESATKGIGEEESRERRGEQCSGDGGWFKNPELPLERNVRV